MLLTEFITTTYCAESEISTSTLRTYCKIASAFGSWLGHPATLEDLPSVSGYIEYLQANRSPAYTATVRSHLLAIWRVAHSLDLAPRAKVRRVKRWCPRPWRWTADEVASLADAARSLKGSYGKDTRASWWRLLIDVAWQTGLRRTDLHRLRQEEVNLDGGRFMIAQHKTGKLTVCHLSPTTSLHFHAMHSNPPLRMHVSEEGFRYVWRRLVKEASVKPGPFKIVRKSAGCWAEQQCPGTGHQLLGNEQRTFERHYLDPNSIADRTPRPPELGS